MVTGCEHDWRWLPRVTFTVGVTGRPRQAVNVECVRCGTQAWAHGKAPNVPPHTIIEHPATERS